MPCRYGSNAAHRIPVELVEADFETAFELTDLSDARPADAFRILADAEAVYADILARLGRLEQTEGSSFEPLVGELRRAIDLARLRHS